MAHDIVHVWILHEVLSYRAISTDLFTHLEALGFLYWKIEELENETVSVKPFQRDMIFCEMTLQFNFLIFQ